MGRLAARAALLLAIVAGCTPIADPDERPTPPDAGSMDAAAADAGDGADAGSSDAGRDGGPDAGDVSATDGAMPDGGRDGGFGDAAGADAGTDGGPPVAPDAGRDAGMDAGMDAGPRLSIYELCMGGDCAPSEICDSLGGAGEFCTRDCLGGAPCPGANGFAGTCVADMAMTVARCVQTCADHSDCYAGNFCYREMGFAEGLCVPGEPPPDGGTDAGTADAGPTAMTYELCGAGMGCATPDTCRVFYGSDDFCSRDCTEAEDCPGANGYPGYCSADPDDGSRSCLQGCSETSDCYFGSECVPVSGGLSVCYPGEVTPRTDGGTDGGLVMDAGMDAAVDAGTDGGAVNQPPTITELNVPPITGVGGGATTSLGCAATDPEGGEITYAWTVGSGSVTAGNPADWTPELAEADVSVTCVATDPEGLSDSASATVRVIVRYDDLLVWLPFHGDAMDASGNGNHGTISGATFTDDLHGNANAALDFDGVDDEVTLGDIDAQTYSLLARVYPRARDGDSRTVANKAPDYYGTYLLSLNPSDHSSRPDSGSFVHDLAAGGNYGHTIITPFPPDTWAQIGCGYDLFGLHLYQNGSHYGSTPISSVGPPALNDAPVRVGMSFRGGWYGVIDDFRLYQVAVSDAEAAAIYASPF